MQNAGGQGKEALLTRLDDTGLGEVQKEPGTRIIISGLRVNPGHMHVITSLCVNSGHICLISSLYVNPGHTHVIAGLLVNNGHTCHLQSVCEPWTRVSSPVYM